MLPVLERAGEYELFDLHVVGLGGGHVGPRALRRCCVIWTFGSRHACTLHKAIAGTVAWQAAKPTPWWSDACSARDQAAGASFNRFVEAARIFDEQKSSAEYERKAPSLAWPRLPIPYMNVHFRV